MSKGLLITGATGKQGGAVVDALIASPSDSSEFTLLAVTRDANSPSAQKLAQKSSNIKIIQGDLNDVPNIFTNAHATHPNIWGVFSVQVPGGQGQTVKTEEAQGKALVDEALKAGVKQFVYTSVDRGGDTSFGNATQVPHFISKHNIEHHLVDKAAGTTMNYTILRPTAFMDNITPSVFSKVFGAAWYAGLPEPKALQLISVSDIGHFAAQAFRRPDDYRNRAISLAGDEVTWSQADQIFKQKTNHGLPATFSFVGHAVLWASHELAAMMAFFRDPGYGADIKKLKVEHPELLSLGEWIEKKSAFTKKS